MKIATWNVNSLNVRLPHLKQWLAAAQPDIVALQEADRRFGTRASAIPPHMFEEHSDYVPVGLTDRPHSIGWHGNALLVRKGIAVEESHALHLPTLEPRGPRQAASCHPARGVGCRTAPLRL